MSAQPPVTLHFVRHGQSTWNVAGRVQGQAPHVPLTPLGHRQAHAAAERLRGCGARHVFTSDLLRARQTAETIAQALGVAAVPVAALREQSLGSLEGRLAAELTAEPVPEGEDITSVRWGGGESIADVHRRVGAFLHELLASPPGRSIVLVAHEGIIQVASACLRGLGPQQTGWRPVPNGSVTTIEYAPLRA
jgi:probable phosphoglycerate mutase